jgi:acetylglutamate/LysW-gamma-L-alpha-aminoadipate kinase
VDDETSVIEKLRFDALDRVMNDVARGRMKKKVMGASEALAAGVQRCIFGDARIERPIRSALAGRGTVIER